MIFDDISAEIERLHKANPEGFSIAEMVDATGRGAGWCRRKVKALIKAGQVRHNGERTESRIDGQRCHVPVYQYRGTDHDR